MALLSLAIWAGSVAVNRYLTKIEEDAQKEREAEAKRIADLRWAEAISNQGTASLGSRIPIIFGRPMVECKSVKSTGAYTINMTYNGDSLFFQSTTYLIGSKVDRVSDIREDVGRGGGYSLTVTYYEMDVRGPSFGYRLVNKLGPILNTDGSLTGQRMGQYPNVFTGWKFTQALSQSSIGDIPSDVFVDADANIEYLIQNIDGYVRPKPDVVSPSPSIGYTIFVDGMPDSAPGPLPTKVDLYYRKTGGTTETVEYGYFKDTFKTYDTYVPSPEWIVDPDLDYKGDPLYTRQDVSRYKGMSLVNIFEMNITGESRLQNKWYARAERQPYTGIYNIDRWTLTVEDEPDYDPNYGRRDNILGANPVGVIAEIFMNAEWGLGLPYYDLDVDAFAEAAELVYNEGIYMSMSVSNMSIKDVLSDCATVGELLVYTNRVNGKISIKALREQLVEDITLGDAEVVALSSYSVDNPSSVPRQVDINFIDSISQDKVSYSKASDNGQLATVTIEASYIDDSTVADRVLTRTANVITARSARLQVVVAESAVTSLNVSDVVRFGSNQHSIPEGNYRVMGITESVQGSGTVTLILVTDTWSRAALPHYVRSEELLVDFARSLKPSNDVVITGSTYFELSYRAIPSNGDEDSIPGVPFMTILAIAPDQWSVKFRSKDLDTKQYSSEGLFSYGTVIRAVLDRATQYMPMNDIGMRLGDYYIYYFGAELVQCMGIVEIDGVAHYKLNRGCHDTVPATHSIGTKVKSLRTDGLRNWTSAVYMLSPVAPPSEARVLTVDDSGNQLDPLEAEYTPLKPAEGYRHFLPPTPTNVFLNATRYPSNISGDIVFTWNHRNHKDDFKVKELKHFLSDDGTTESNTYIVKLYFDGSLYLAYQAATTSTGITIDSATILTSNGGVPPDDIRITLEGYNTNTGTGSWQLYEYNVSYGDAPGLGWDFDWSNNWDN